MVTGSHVRRNVDVVLFLYSAHNVAYNPAALRSMAFYAFKLIAGKLSGLLQNAVGNRYLSDVMHGSRL